VGANERVRMGYIGLGNRGDQVHDALDLAVKKSRATPKRYKEYRKLLEDKEVDAVVIATPDHWHAIMFLEACNAGKDVYVEKPLSLTVYEGRRMVETAERPRRVVQVGTNRRSWKSCFQAADCIRSGGLGRVSVARCFHIRNEWPLGLSKVPDGRPPRHAQTPDRGAHRQRQRELQHRIPHPQFPRLHQDPRQVQRRRPDRTSVNLVDAHRQHRPQAARHAGVGQARGAVHQRPARQRVAAL